MRENKSHDIPEIAALLSLYGMRGLRDGKKGQSAKPTAISETLTLGLDTLGGDDGRPSIKLTVMGKWTTGEAGTDRIGEDEGGGV